MELWGKSLVIVGFCFVALFCWLVCLVLFFGRLTTLMLQRIVCRRIM